MLIFQVEKHHSYANNITLWHPQDYMLSYYWHLITSDSFLEA